MILIKSKLKNYNDRLIEVKIEAMAVNCDVDNVESIKQSGVKTRTHLGNKIF